MKTANAYINNEITTAANQNQLRSVKTLPSTPQDMNNYISQLITACELTNLMQATD